MLCSEWLHGKYLSLQVDTIWINSPVAERMFIKQSRLEYINSSKKSGFANSFSDNRYRLQILPYQLCMTDTQTTYC